MRYGTVVEVLHLHLHHFKKIYIDMYCLLLWLVAVSGLLLATCDVTRDGVLRNSIYSFRRRRRREKTVVFVLHRFGVRIEFGHLAKLYNYAPISLHCVRVCRCRCRCY